MKKILYFLFVSFAIASNSNGQFKVSDLSSSSWIPSNIKWDSKNYFQASFETFYFYNDSEFVKIASTQSLAKKDSINFRAEPGFILYQGTFSFSKDGKGVTLKYRRLYRTFEVSGEKLPSEYIFEKALLLTKEKKKIISIKDKQYLKTNKFTKQSLNSIKDLIEKFLPSISN
jgi:hypothetical protein